jgi:PAS domain S-box-containing protein
MTNNQLQNRITELELELSNLKSSTLVVQKSLENDVRFRNFIELSIYPILILKGEDMIMEIANDAILKIFNVGKEALGKPLVEILPEMKDQPFIGLLLDVLHNHVTNYGNEQPAYFVRENGEKEIVYFDFVYHPYKENDGTVSGVLVYATDVTEKVLVRKKAEESDAQFRRIVMQAPVAIGIYNGKEYIADVVNEYALLMLNREVDFIGKPLFVELPELEKQGLKTIMDNVMQSGITYYGNELEFTIHKNNISTQGFYNLIIQQLKAENESVTGIIIVASEVTEQVLARKKVEESEHRYHNLVYTSPYMIAIFKGKDTIIEIANDAIIETWGKGKDIFGKSLFEVLPETVEQGFDKLIQNVYETGEPFHAYETPVTLIRNGKEELMHYNFIYQAQRNVQGEIEGVAILANEVTPQVEAKIKIEENDKQQAYLLKLSDALMSLTSPQQIKVKAMQVLGEHLNVTRCYYAEILKDGKHCLIDNSFSFGIGTIDGTYKLEDFGKAKVDALQRGEVILTTDVANDTSVGQEERNRNLEMQIHAYINVPLIKDNKLICLLGVNQSAVRNWTAIDLTIVKETAERTWAAVERAKTEKELWESERNLRKTTEHFEIATTAAEVGTWSLDLASQTLEWSDLHKKMWGYDEHRTDLVYEDWHKVILASDKEVAFTALAKALKTKTPYETSYRIKREDNEDVRWMRASGKYLYNDAGEAVTLAGISMDITEQKNAEIVLKESEERFRLLADNMPLNVFLADATLEDNITYLNKYWLDFTKQSFSEATSKGWFYTIHPDDVHLVMSVYEPAFKNRQAYIIPKFRIKRYDGEYRWFTFQAIPRYLPNGEYIGYMGIGFDINEQKLFELELIDEKQKAENAAKSKQQFLANMSHEIRTPLNSIVGFANVLTKTVLSENQKEFVEAIKTSGNSLHLLINDILDLAKVDAGKMTFEKQPFEMHKKIKSVLHSFDLKIKEKNIQLVSEYDTEIPHMVVGDSLRLNQIILNLMSNAIKFTHKGKITFSVKLQSQNADNVFIEFSINDTGIGIAAEKINSIFNLFEQAEISTANSYGGTGLGLAIVKQLVEAQGGSINVKSKLGEGSTFSFLLPFGKTTTQKNENIETIIFDSKIKNLRILVAEDVALNQLLIKIILSDFGFEYDVVDNGKLAIEKLQNNTYDIILMDLQMPDINGFEATDYIRNTMKSNIPIIALTADVTTADVDKCKAFGMDDYISKPINENQLYSKIIEVIKRKQ